MIDNFDNISNEYKFTVPRGTILMRISNPLENDLAPFRYFSYWRGNFYESYKTHKLMFEEKLKSNSTIEFWKFTNDTTLLITSYNAINYDDDDDDKKIKQIEEYKNLFDILHINDSDKKCYLSALRSVFFSESNYNEIRNCKDKYNADNILAHMFSDLNLRGWIRLVYKQLPSPADEILLTNDEVRKQLDFIGRITVEQFLNNNFFPAFIDKKFEQPQIFPDYIAGGGDNIYKKYLKYKQKYLNLKKN